MKLDAYEAEAVELLEWDARAPAVAARLVAQVRSVRVELEPEHVGSTSVPGLAGKGVIDLVARVRSAELVAIVDALLASGWQRQTGPRAWPEARPMLVAAIEHEGASFRSHLHLIPETMDDADVMIAFRDQLRADPELRARYVARKRAVLDAGIDHGPDYAEAKSDVVVGALRELGKRS